MLSTPEIISPISKGNLSKYGAILLIDKDVSIDYSKPLCFDVETTGIGRDVFVGVGFTQDGVSIHYHSKLDLFRVLDWSKLSVLGHNIKFDLHQLDAWGVNIEGFKILSDSMIMSYVYNTTARTHSLKPLAKMYLNLEWPTYSEMTTYFEERISYKKYEAYVDESGKKKRKKLEEPIKLVKQIKKSRTLAEVSVEEVAEYCGMDVLASWRLSNKMYQLMNISQRRIYNTLELPTLNILFNMESTGIQVDLDELKSLHGSYKERLKLLDEELKEMAGLPELNPGSSKQLVPILEGLGLVCPMTKKKNKSVAKGFLLKHRDKPFVQSLLDYRATHKIFSTYLDGFLKLPSLPRVHSTFNQVRYDSGEDEWEGMSTNRLSSSDPNMQNIPKRGEDAKLIRKLFIPKEGYSLIVGDYSQIEYRLLAHFSQDRTLLDAFNTGKDLHDEVGKALNCVREAAKQINYACVIPSTKTITADLQWKEVGSLELGERILTCEENNRLCNLGRGRARRWTIAEVTHNKRSTEDCVEVELDNGSRITCTKNHPFLVNNRKGMKGRWCEASKLRTGWRIPKYLEMWEEDKSYDAGWLSGMMDGEGFVNQCSISVAQKLGVLSDRIESLCKRFSDSYIRRDGGNSPCKHYVIKGGFSVVAKVLGILRPARLINNFLIWTVGKATINAISFPRVVRVMPVGKKEIVQLTTSKHTYVTEGYFSHNCIYGATAPKVSDLAKISVIEAESLLKKHEERFPRVYYWKNRELSKARKNLGVYTLLGRFIPIPGLISDNKWDRMRSERQAINYIIQGSAAEVIKLAMISCVQNGYDPILQVHDELIFEVEESKADGYMAKIKDLMETVVKFDVPINVDIHVGSSWAEAKI